LVYCLNKEFQARTWADEEFLTYVLISQSYFRSIFSSTVARPVSLQDSAFFLRGRCWPAPITAVASPHNHSTSLYAHYHDQVAKTSSPSWVRPPSCLSSARRCYVYTITSEQILEGNNQIKEHGLISYWTEYLQARLGYMHKF
jgi:hypothetical protein